jgi:hypothetical protein
MPHRCLPSLALPALTLLLAAPVRAGWEEAPYRSLTLAAPAAIQLRLRKLKIDDACQVGIARLAASGVWQTIPLIDTYQHEPAAGEATSVAIEPGETIRIQLHPPAGMSSGTLTFIVEQVDGKETKTTLGMFGLRWVDGGSGVEYRTGVLDPPWGLEDGAEGRLTLSHPGEPAGAGTRPAEPAMERKHTGFAAGQESASAALDLAALASFRGGVENLPRAACRIPATILAFTGGASEEDFIEHKALEFASMKQAIAKANLIKTCRIQQSQLQAELERLILAAAQAAPAPAELERVRAIKDKALAIEALIQNSQEPARKAMAAVLSNCEQERDSLEQKILELHLRTREAESEVELDTLVTWQHRFWQDRRNNLRLLESYTPALEHLDRLISPAGRQARVCAQIVAKADAYLRTHVVSPALRAELLKADQLRSQLEQQRREARRQAAKAEAKKAKEAKEAKDEGAAAARAGAGAGPAVAGREERKAAEAAGLAAAREREQRERADYRRWRAELRAAREAGEREDAAHREYAARAGAGAAAAAAPAWNGYRIEWHPDARKDLGELSPAIAEAIEACAARVAQYSLGFSISTLRVKHVVGGRGGLYEMRPRGEAELCRPLFMRGADNTLRILAIAPEGEKNPKGFNRVRDKADTLAEALRRAPAPGKGAGAGS